MPGMLLVPNGGSGGDAARRLRRPGDDVQDIDLGGNLKSCLRKMRIHRVASIAGENSINFELNFQILSDDRGPGPLSSDEIWKFNSKFIEFSPAIEATR